jgi:hypothetical protein
VTVSTVDAQREANALTPNPQDHREWIFTFGAGQRLVPPLNYWEFPVLIPAGAAAVVAGPAGLDLTGRYVRIGGTYQEARAEMTRRYGLMWAGQYEDDLHAAVELDGLRELDPPPSTAWQHEMHAAGYPDCGGDVATAVRMLLKEMEALRAGNANLIRNAEVLADELVLGTAPVETEPTTAQK